ncbi:MAG: chemotaxis protein CheW [Gammaproteobacteria bacterium]|nr:chemotaxis protein CheW [Gammaproteobacteria bacterium]MDH5801620.1 chemotaxis protein CheW [Gammaproteobacteria bacterium]
MPEIRAWLLPFKREEYIAVGNHHMAEYIYAPTLEVLPLQQNFCPGMLKWREKFIPVIDLAYFTHPGESQPTGYTGAMVLAFQEQEGQTLQYAALGLRSAPVLTMVAEEQACPMPEDLIWQTLAVSSFVQSGKTIPVLNVSELFSSNLPVLYQEVTRQVHESTEMLQSKKAAG